MRRIETLPDEVYRQGFIDKELHHQMLLGVFGGHEGGVATALASCVKKGIRRKLAKIQRRSEARIR